MAANTLLSELGGKVIQGSQHNENIETYLADGTCKAGWLVGIEGTDLLVHGADDAALEFFVGIALPRYDTDCDTAFTTSDPIDIVIPKSGNYYAVLMENPADTLQEGHMLTFSNTAGAVEKCATFDGGSDLQTIATNKEQVITGTTFAIIRWL